MTARNIIAYALIAMAANSDGIAQAGRLHIIIAADEGDRSVGEYSAADASTMVEVFAGLLPRNAYILQQIPIQEMTSRGIMRFLDRNLRPAPDDSVLFYFSGHGGYNRQAGHFLALRHNSESLQREALLKQLKRRNPQFVALVTESCFNLVDVVPPVVDAAPTGPVPNNIPPLFRRLFFDLRGVVDLNGCKQGQKSMTFPLEKDGSLFTAAFAEVLSQNADSPSLGWRDFVKVVREETNESFARIYGEGVTLRTVTGRVNQRSQDPEFVTALSIREFGSAGSRLVTYEDFEIVINPENGMVTSHAYNKTYDPRTQQTTSVVVGSQSKGQAKLVTGSGGIKLWGWGSLFVVAKPDAVPAAPEERVQFGVRFVRTNGRVEVAAVTPNSPATRMLDLDTKESLKLERGDRVISVNGVPTSDYREAVQLVNNTGFDLTVEVRDVRNGRIRRLSTRLVGSRRVARKPALANPDRLGVTCHTCKEGVHVDTVQAGRPATRMRAGDGRIFRIEKNDHIYSLAGSRVRNVSEFETVLRNAPQDTTIRIKNRRSGKTQRFSIRLD